MGVLMCKEQALATGPAESRPASAAFRSGGDPHEPQGVPQETVGGRE